MKINFSKIFFAAGLAILLTVSLTSCHPKEGCPNKITETGVINMNENT